MAEMDKAIAAAVEETLGETWPVIAYVVYARVTDPESMTVDQPVWIIPEGQRSFVTRGLLEEALSELESDSLPVFTFAEFEDDGDDD